MHTDIADWVRSCLSKKAYSNVVVALDVAAKARRERGADLVVYPCRHCEYWHVAKRKRLARG